MDVPLTAIAGSATVLHRNRPLGWPVLKFLTVVRSASTRRVAAGVTACGYFCIRTDVVRRPGQRGRVGRSERNGMWGQSAPISKGAQSGSRYREVVQRS